MTTYWHRHPLLTILKLAATKHRTEAAATKAWKKITAYVDEIGPEDPVGTVVPMELPLEGKVALGLVVGELPVNQRDCLLLELTDVSARDALRALVVERHFPKWEPDVDGNGSEMKGPCPGPLFDLVKAKLAEVNAAMVAWEANRDDDTFHHAFDILQGMEEIKRRLDPDDCLCL